MGQDSLCFPKKNIRKTSQISNFIAKKHFTIVKYHGIIIYVREVRKWIGQYYIFWR